MSQNEDATLFKKLIAENRYDFQKLAYLIFPFGEPGHELEHVAPYDWQQEEWAKLSKHLMNPETRYESYRLIISSGNGAAKTAFGAMTLLMLMYTQKLRCRITANTDPQMKQVIWPEYDKWFRYARFHENFFEKFGTSIKAKNETLADTWRIDSVTWSAESPVSISGLHNKGFAVAYAFEEAPGIPACIWDYTRGAFMETDTIKLFLAFGNSDDPESKFEQNMASPLWHSRRIDTRELSHIDQNEIADILHDCNGNEDHDEFRVRVRGLPRKTSKDSVIGHDNVVAAIERGKNFDFGQVAILPCMLMCDPAWTGGDETVIWMRQGQYCKMLERFKLDKTQGDTHNLTYQKLCFWERELNADAVYIDQAEGTAVYTLATNAGRTSWFLISFASSPNDQPEPKDSEYANIRAQMFYEADKFLRMGGVIAAREEEWLEDIQKQLCWTKGGRHKVTNKKLCESKIEIKQRVGQSPDIADGFVLGFAAPLLERLPEHETGSNFVMGGTPLLMPAHPDPYATLDADYRELYD